MSQWKNDDSAANSPLWVASSVNKTVNTANRDAMFGNVTPSAFVNNQVVGVFGVSAAEAGVANGTVHSENIVFRKRGSGYAANANITVSGGSFATTPAGNAHANSTGRIDNILFSNNGVGVVQAPSIVVDPPAAVTFNALTAVSNTAETIAIATANSKFLAGDVVQYLVAAGNTAIGGLSNGSLYYVAFSNTTVLTLAATSGGANIDLTASVSETGHSLTGETAVVEVVIASGKAVAHAGWNLRTVGTGGRAGRVTYECLVASGSMTGDASDDTVLKDS